MTMKAQFEMMATYNRWANRRLYQAAAELPDADYRRPLGAFFGSLHGTLNHLLAADRIWMHRFTGEGPTVERLDAVLFEDLRALRQAREAEDARISAYVGGLDETALAGVVRYRTISKPAEIEQPLPPALVHFFNHQTHHRGQAHCLLTQLTGSAPSFDLIVLQRESGIGMGRA